MQGQAGKPQGQLNPIYSVNGQTLCEQSTKLICNRGSWSLLCRRSELPPLCLSPSLTAAMLPGRSYKAAVGFRHSTFVPTRPYVCLFAASATRLERRRHTAAKPLTSICCLAETTIDQHHNDSKTESSSDDRKKRRKPVQGPTVIAQSAAAASAGPLPEVLSATFPATFPTLSAARRGKNRAEQDA